MKRINRWLKMEPEKIALVLGFTIGLGLVVHQVLLVLPLIVVLIVAADWTLEQSQKCLRDVRWHPQRS